MRQSYLFTSESVSEGHPDKVADQISDAIVDLFLSKDPEARVACETLTTTNKVVLAGEIRGRGAMMAVEIVKPGTTTPDPDLTKAVNAACHAAGVITLTAGTYGNVLRFLPPLVISDDLLGEALDVLEEAFATQA